MNSGPVIWSTAKPLYRYQVAVKESVTLIVGHNARRMGSSEDPNSPGFQVRRFYRVLGKGWLRYFISLWTNFWLVGVEVTGWYCGNLGHQSLASRSLGSMCGQQSPIGGALVPVKTTQECERDCYLYPSRRKKGFCEVFFLLFFFLWLILFKLLLPFLPACFFFVSSFPLL